MTPFCLTYLRSTVTQVNRYVLLSLRLKKVPMKATSITGLIYITYGCQGDYIVRKRRKFSLMKVTVLYTEDGEKRERKWAQLSICIWYSNWSVVLAVKY